MLTTRLTVATKMILQIVVDSWILRVAWNTVDPYTLPTSNHSLLQINGIRKCDRNIKYSAAVLPSNFEIRVVCDGPSHASCSSVYVRLIEIFVLDIYNNFLLGDSGPRRPAPSIAMRLAAGSIVPFGSLLAWREGAMHQRSPNKIVLHYF